MKRAHVLAALLLAGCNYTAPLHDYCNETGECVCSGNDCCITAGHACDVDDSLCCNGTTCNASGVCEAPPLPPAPHLAFGVQSCSSIVAAAGTDWSTPCTLINDGNLATGTLTLAIAPSDLFSLAEDDCTGQILQPSKTCFLSVTFTPPARGSFSGELDVTEHGTMHQLAISGTGN